jgi:DNA-binding MarR family transcriptional regulator/N-acetylglutamate synthase-like GNAT family acetyltransferase
MGGSTRTAMRAGREIEGRVEAVRRFSRFYTQKIGVLQETLLKSPFSLTEGRVIYELGQRESATASALAADLGLDPGYLSRILRGFRQRGLVHRERSTTDGRQSLLRLTAQGQKAFAALNARSQGEITTMLGALSAADQGRLVAALQTVETLMGAPPERRAPYILRPHQPGDMGWIVHRHGALYAQEYGWDERFEALVTGVAAEFIERFDPKRERCWIAEIEGEIVGAVLLVRKSATVAKLRLLLVEPKARGHGIGGRLVEECIRFARRAGYRKITLWTNSILLAARHLYERAGFKLVREERHKSFGQNLVGETWELVL